MIEIIDYTPAKLLSVGNFRGWLSDAANTTLKCSGPLFSVIDRTETLDLGIKLKIIDKIPVGSTEKTLEEICDQEAVKLISSGKPLSVYWSGGIDSTLVLVSLLKNNAKDLTVVLTGKSIDEYPLFFEKFIDKKLNYRRIRPSVFSDIDTNEVNVSGEFGDQIMGSVDIMDYISKFNLIHTDPWEKYVLQNKGDKYLSIISEQVKRAPFKIVSVFDFLWWKNYSCKWQHVLMRMGNNEPGSNSKYLESIHHFFRADDFQLWSMNEANHRTEKLKDSFTSYKHSMKRIIANYTKDKDYQENKIKIGSLPTVLAMPFLFRLSNGVSISFGAKSESPIDYEQKFGDKYDYLFSK